MSQNVLITPGQGSIFFDKSPTGASTKTNTNSAVEILYNSDGGLKFHTPVYPTASVIVSAGNVVATDSLSAKKIFSHYPGLPPNYPGQNSDYWGSVYTTTNAESANWGAGGSGSAVLAANSAKWDSTYTSVENNSANWDSVYTSSSQNSAGWESTESTVATFSGDWSTVTSNITCDNIFLRDTSDDVGRINFWQNASKLAPPAPYGANDKITLWDFKGSNPSGYNYAIGAEGSHIWFTMDVTGTGGGFKFYSQNNELFLIRSDGNLILNATKDILEAGSGTSLLLTTKAKADTTYTSVKDNSANWDSAYTSSSQTSASWNSVYTSTKNNSANWDSVYTSTKNNSANWDSVYTSASQTSANWDSVYTTTETNSASWGAGGSANTVLAANSAKWDSVYNSVGANSGSWDSVYTSSSQTSSNWDSVYNSVEANSGNWDSVYTSAAQTSANWDSNYTSSKNNSANWNSVYTTTKNNSATWESAYTSSSQNSANWDSVYNSSAATSGNWDSTYTSVKNNSTNWDSTYNSVKSNSGTWDSVYTSTTQTSATWNSVYTQMRDSSGAWLDETEANALYFRVSGGTIYGDVNIQNDLVVGNNLFVTGSATFASTIFTSTSALSVINTGQGPALFVKQGPGPGDIASFYDADGIEALHIGDAKYTLGQDPDGVIGIKTSFPNKTLSVVGEISATGSIYTTGKYLSSVPPGGIDGSGTDLWDLFFDKIKGNDVFTNVYTNSASWGAGGSGSTVLAANSANWDSTYTSVKNNSANWDSVYNSAAATSANWNSTYTSVKNNSAEWGSVYTSSSQNSANWDSNYTSSSQNSANWDSVYTSSKTSSASWNSVYTSTKNNSANWDSTYTSTKNNSANWDSVYNSVGANSGNWDSVYTSASQTSANWDSVYTTTKGNSAFWGNVYTSIAQNSANWDSNYTSTSQNSANWDSVYTSSKTNSANWDSVYNSSAATSGNWDSTYTSVKNNSADWGSAYTSSAQNSANWDSTYTSTKNNSANWDSVYTSSSQTSANWESVYTSSKNNSANWDSVYTSTSQNSANWDSVYSSTKTNSSNWDSVYTTVDQNSASWLNQTDASTIFLKVSGGVINIDPADPSNGDGGTLTVYKGLSAGITSGNFVVKPNFNIGNNSLLFVDGANNRVGIRTNTPAYTLHVNGDISGTTGYYNHIAAETKSFYIKHPSKPDMHLQYGSLESPYHGIRLTGSGIIVNDSVTIELPDYVPHLVRIEDANVQLTNYKHSKLLWVDSINISQEPYTNNFVVKKKFNLFKKPHHFFWSFTAIRKDIPPLQVEV